MSRYKLDFPIFAAVILCLLFQEGVAYKHVIFMHGLLSDPSEFGDFHRFIQKDHPGTNVTVIDAYNDYDSLANMWTQALSILPTVERIMAEHPEGVHFLCYSQGGLLCRALIELSHNHNVDTFISLSAPQGGQYGGNGLIPWATKPLHELMLTQGAVSIRKTVLPDTDVIHLLFPNDVKHNLYRIFYTRFGQGLSIANYWNDPHHQPLYLEYSQLLATINNQKPTNQSQTYKTNFSRLKRLVLIGGPDDGVITPWQSSHFAAYNASESVIEMKQQQWYINDMFGLRSLDRKGIIQTYTVPGVTHFQWHKNYTVWKNCIEKWLT